MSNQGGGRGVRVQGIDQRQGRAKQRNENISYLHLSSFYTYSRDQRHRGALQVTFFFNKVVQNNTFYSLVQEYDPARNQRQTKARLREERKSDEGGERGESDRPSVKTSVSCLASLLGLTLGLMKSPLSPVYTGFFCTAGRIQTERKIKGREEKNEERREGGKLTSEEKQKERAHGENRRFNIGAYCTTPTHKLGKLTNRKKTIYYRNISLLYIKRESLDFLHCISSTVLHESSIACACRSAMHLEKASHWLGLVVQVILCSTRKAARGKSHAPKPSIFVKKKKKKDIFALPFCFYVLFYVRSRRFALLRWGSVHPLWVGCGFGKMEKWGKGEGDAPGSYRQLNVQQDQNSGG